MARKKDIVGKRREKNIWRDSGPKCVQTGKNLTVLPNKIYIQMAKLAQEKKHSTYLAMSQINYSYNDS